LTWAVNSTLHNPLILLAGDFRLWAGKPFFWP
jgi:hypothetical protein